MAWGRLNDRANGDAKLLALTDAAWRMWGCGLIYCQANLTDGFIPDHAVHSFGVRAKNKAAVIGELCRSLVPGKGPLWHPVENGYQVHDYLDWNDSREDIIAERERNRQRVERFRGKKNPPARRPETGRDAPLRNALQSAVGTTDPLPLPQLDLGQFVPTEGSEPPAGDSAPPAVLEFPVVGPGGPTWSLTEAQLAEWSDLFPALDALGEARSALAWLRADPRRRKTASGMGRFLVGWLTRSTNGRHAGATAVPARPPGVAPASSGWACPHVDRCGHQTMCQVKLAHPAKNPIRSAVPA